MDTLTDRLERLAELQKKNLEPLQNLGGNAFAAFERVARKNYELMGDMVEYAVAQSRGSLEQRSPQALYERQMVDAKAFAERMGVRAAEYAALAAELRTDATPGGHEAASARAAPGGSRSSDPSKATDAAPSGTAVPGERASTGASPKKVTAKAPSRQGTGTSAKKAAPRKGAGTGAKAASAGKTAAKKATSKKRAASASATKKSATKKPAARKGTGTGAKKRAARARSAG